MMALQELAAGILARGDDGPAIRFDGQWRTWAEVRSLARDVQRLIAASGAPGRGRVLFLARNLPELIAALLGLIADGRSIAMLYSFQSPAAIAREIARIAPALVIGAEQDFGGEIPGAIKACGGAAIGLRAMSAGPLPGLERWVAVPGDSPPVEPVIELQTSGTTGPPKRFPVTYAKAHRHFVERLVPPGMKPPEIPALLFMSLGNLSGMMGTLPALLTGQPMLLYDRFSLDIWRDYVRTYRPERGGLPPTMLPALLELKAPPDELSGFQSLTMGSAPVDPRAHRAFEAYYGVPLLLAYGATEFYGTVAMETLESHAGWDSSRFGTVGRAIPGVELRIVDQETGAPAAAGETGLIEVLSAEIGPGWIRTSDLGMMDADGFLFIRGRADGAIIRGGFKLVPETIEKALASHEAVAAAAVVGVPDRRLGQAPGAAVQFAAGAAPLGAAELEAWLRQQLPATHIPVHWRFVAELPKNVSVKIDRRAVLRLFVDESQREAE